MACAPRSPPGDCRFAPRNPNGTRTQSAPSWCRRGSTARMSSMLLSVATIWRQVRVSPRFRASCSASDGHLGDLNDLMVLGALAGAEMAMRDVGIGLTLGSGVAATPAHSPKTKMAKKKKPTGQERFAQTQPEGVFHP